jgi:sialate O-acetylesterase
MRSLAKPRVRHCGLLLWVSLVTVGSVQAPAHADVTLHGLFTDNMVLQRDSPVAIYGCGDEGESVTVRVGDGTASTTVRSGTWKVVLPPMQAGGPHTLLVAATNTLARRNVLVGDVWVCAGQSNMATLLKLYKEGAEYAAYRHLFEGVPQRNDRIRLFKAGAGAADTPQPEMADRDEAGGGWQACDEKSAMQFSALGYLFGSRLQQEIGVPVGLIHAAVGGTMAECWVSHDTLESTPELQVILDRFEVAKQRYPEAQSRYEAAVAAAKAGTYTDRRGRRMPPEPMGPQSLRRPAGLYNSMIAPLQQFRIKGVIWYQGEGNAAEPVQYRTLFSALITSWRRQWGQGDFPFLFVQLAGFDRVNPEPEDSSWAWLREAQAMQRVLPNTGMAVAIDAGHQTNIHPPNKPLVAERLVAAALQTAYGHDVVASGPSFRRITIREEAAVIEFDNVGGGLVVRAVDLDGGIHLSADEIKGFSLCGEDRVFKWGRAVIEGDTVVVSHPDIQKPVAVRYAWANFPLCNLYNAAGFPAVPFRTDQFTRQVPAR